MAGCRGKLNKELISAIAKAVEEDMPNVEACALFRIHESTFYYWKQKGEQDLLAGINSLEREFLEAIKEAEGRAIKRGLANIKRASMDGKQWQAGAWILERCYRKRFAQNADQFEKLEKQINDLAARLDKRSQKSVGAKVNDKVDSESDKK